MKFPETATLKEGHKEQFEKDVKAAMEIGKGRLGWDGQAEMMVELGFDALCFETLKTTKEERIKEMRLHIISIHVREVFRHFVGFTDQGLPIETNPV